MDSQEAKRKGNTEESEDESVELPEWVTLPFSDCVLVSETGLEYPSIKGLLAVKSKVFKDLIASCPTVGVPLHIPLAEHDDEEVELLWRQLHGINPVITEETFIDCGKVDLSAKSGEVLRLTAIAHKFDITGEDPL
jgi:hypothetical protein